MPVYHMQCQTLALDQYAAFDPTDRHAWSQIAGDVRGIGL